MQENKKFPHEQLDDLVELDDLTLESFEEAQSEFVIYPEDDDGEFELDDLDLFDAQEALDDLEALDYEDDLVDIGDLDELELLDELEEMEPEPEQDDQQQRQKASEAQRALQGISKMLDALIQEDGDEVADKQAAKPVSVKQLETRPERRPVIDAEFREIAETTDNLDRILAQSKGKSTSDKYVSDLYEHTDWDLVIDEELLERTEAMINSVNQTNETLVKAQGVEKKSLSTLATALLAGGGVLVFGLATAGVATVFRSLRQAKKQKTTEYYEPQVQIKPAVEPKPDTAEQKVIAPDPVRPMHHVEENLYRDMPPQYRYPPARPFWGPAPPPPANNDKGNIAI